MTKPGLPRQFLQDAADGYTTDCIDWPFTATPRGYGQIRDQGRDRPATQVVLEMAGRPSPGPHATYVLHSCDRPCCVNPLHLRWGSQAENLADARAKRRIQSGERRYNARFTNEQVRAIRARHQRGETRKALADEHGMSVATMNNIISGRRYPNALLTPT